MNLFVPKLLLSFEWMHQGIQIKGVTSLTGHSDCNSCLWIQAYLKKLKSTELIEHMYGKSGKKLLKLPYYLNVLFLTLVLFVEPAIIPQNLNVIYSDQHNCKSELYHSPVLLFTRVLEVLLLLIKLCN